MKTLSTIIIVFLSISLFSQDCKYSKNETDPFTNKKKLTLNWAVFAKGATERKERLIYTFRVAMFRYGDRKGIYCHYNNDMGCLTKYSYVELMLKDSTQLRLKNIAGIKCDAMPVMAVELTDIDVNLLLAQPVILMRYSLDDGYNDMKHFADAEYFIKNLGCLEL